MVHLTFKAPTLTSTLLAAECSAISISSDSVSVGLQKARDPFPQYTAAMAINLQFLGEMSEEH